MNIRCDLRAKKYLHQCIVNNLPSPSSIPFLHKSWSVSIQGVKQASISRDSLYAAIYGPTTLQYYNKNDKVPLDPSLISWSESCAARRRAGECLTRIITKISADCRNMAVVAE